MSARTWFITGVNSGFGREMTEQLLAQGERVAGTTRKLDSMAELAAQYPETLWLAALDVTDTAAIRRVVAQAFAHFGRIDVVVNNAGYGLFGAAEELTDEQIDHQLQTNVIGSIQVVRAVLPFLRAQGGGRILQLSSMGGQVAFPGMPLYHASKWAMEGFFESAAQDIAPFNIQTTLVEPGGARTNFAGGSAVVSEPMDVYAETPAGMIRQLLAAGTGTAVGDPAKVARAMIDSVAIEPAPKRLTLGSDAYEYMRLALSTRLAALEAQRDLAYSTDFELVEQASASLFR